ncbi:hypothetical protein ACWF9G_27215 [Nocardia sp. NPDC055029]
MVADPYARQGAFDEDGATRAVSAAVADQVLSGAQSGLASPRPLAGPSLLLSGLMLGVDAVLLLPLGEWMRDYGIVVVSATYLLHVLGSTALGVWAASHLRAAPL